jgi:uncharacterized protein (TIGR02145 family)
MKNKSLLMTIAILIIALSSVAQETGTFTDSRDGKVYKTVKIGTQTWFAENLAYKVSKGCWAYNNDTSNVKTYGYLYNWKAAITACPTGWHLPSDAEWTTLIIYLGGENVAGDKLKEIGTTHWEKPNTGATNESGFTALPGGYRYPNLPVENLGYSGYWWSSTEKVNSYGSYWFRVVSYKGSMIYRYDRGEMSAYSVRCIKD